MRAGLRRSECFGVKWIDFDLDHRTVTVERQFRAGRVIDRTKKNRVRVVNLSKETCEEFRAHRALMQQRYVTLQHFRQTFCTGIVASSGNIAYASKQAGHASIKVTGDYDSHWAPDENRHLTDALDDRVRKAAQSRARMRDSEAASP